MFGKHALAAKILQEAEDKGIALVTVRPIDGREYHFGPIVGQECYPDVKLLPESHEDIPIVSSAMAPKLTGMTAEEYLNRKELLAGIGKKTAREELRDMSIPKIDKFTPEQRKAYQERQDKLRQAATKMARDAEAIERALARFRKFDLKEGQEAALKYISSMMPKHYEVSTDGKVLDHDLPTRYGTVRRLYIRIKDLKTGFRLILPIDVIDGMICIPSVRPRRIKGVFEFQLKQHLDYEVRFKKRDQDRLSELFVV